jgi:hypothetical protein
MMATLAVFDCRTANDPAMMSSAIFAHTFSDVSAGEISRKIRCTESLFEPEVSTKGEIMITFERFRDAHLPHRRSILEEYIANRQNTTRPGFSCYIDSALITCRALCGLLGFEIDSRNVSDMGDATQPTVKFGRFSAIRKNLDRRIVIDNVKNEKELRQIPHWEEIIVCLNAANKCVAHFDEYSDLEHKADPNTVAVAAGAVLREVNNRIELVGS